MAPLFAYALCALTSAGCFALLWRGYARNRVGLLLWMAVFFGAFTLNNALLILHFFTQHQAVLITGRMVTLVGALVLVYGLVKESP